jgi:hypothetical protein
MAITMSYITHPRTMKMWFVVRELLFVVREPWAEKTDKF